MISPMARHAGANMTPAGSPARPAKFRHSANFKLPGGSPQTPAPAAGARISRGTASKPGANILALLGQNSVAATAGPAASATSVLTAPPKEAPTPSPSPVSKPSPATNAVAFDNNTPLQVLAQALQAAGIDPGSLGMVAHDDTVGYPGGGAWVNHLITLQAGSHVENFSADLMMKSPNVTVNEIKRLIAMG